MKAFSSRPRVATRLLGVVLAVLILGGVFAPGASAAVCSASELTPQLRATTVNQGLGSYPDLVQGKDILVRYYLSRPACADTSQTITVTSASLNIKAGGLSVGSVPAPTNNLTPAPEISLYASAPATNSTGDPLFKVAPGSLNVPAGPPTPLTFEATIGWKNSFGATGTAIYPVSKNMLPRTDSLRVMGVPMGTSPNPLGSLDDATNRRFRAIIDGFAHLGRIDPVANGIGDLSTAPSLPAPGIQYYLNKSTYLDISNHLSSGKFCGDKDGTLLSTLAGLQEQHNTANPLSQTVDRVLGLADQALSCTNRQGEAVVGGKAAWVQVRYDDPATTTVEPSLTGALMAHEEFHNDGGVPCGAYRPDTDPLTPETQCGVDRDSITDPNHSPRTAADGTDVDRAYNLFGFNGTAPTWLLQDRSVARYADAGWDNNNTLFERDDWNLSLCRRGGPTTNDCTLPLERSLSSAQNNDEVTVLVGYTDGTPAGTAVFDSFAEEEGGANEPPASSPLTLVQRNEFGAELSRTPVEAVDLRDTPGGGTGSANPVLFFGAAYESDPLAARLELVGPDGVVLYARSEFAEARGIRNTGLEISARGTAGPGCPPAGCPVPSVLASEDDFSAEAQADNKLTFEDLTNGAEVESVYSDSHGISFESDETTTPRIVGDCLQDGDPCRFPPGTPTQSGHFNVWNQPNTLPVGPVDPVPSSAGIPLTISFVGPVAKVGMYIGNDDTNSTTATLTAFDEQGAPIPGAIATKQNFGAAVDEFIGLDAGINRIASVQLSYGASILGEEIDDLIYEFGDDSVTPITEWRATATADHDEPNLLRAAFFAKCSDDQSPNDFIRIPLETGVKPASIDGETATFHHDFDSTIVCSRGGRVTILVRFNDGYTQSTFIEDFVRGPVSAPPVAVISSPAVGAKVANILSHEAMSFVGFGWDHEDGTLPDSSLEWSLTYPNGTTESVGTGSSLTLPAPTSGCGWTDGLYTARLDVTDSRNKLSSTTVPFEVLKDCDNDGIGASVEPCFGGSDSASRDAFGDFDRDGVVNQQDEDPCTGRATYDAIGDFDPNTLNVPSTGGSQSITVKVTLKYRDLKQVSDDPNTLRILEIGGADVSTDPRFKNMGWTVSTVNGVQVGVAKFDRQALISFLYDEHGITDAQISLLIGGEASAQSGKPAFTFTAADNFDVQKDR